MSLPYTSNDIRPVRIIAETTIADARTIPSVNPRVKSPFAISDSKNNVLLNLSV